MGHRQYKLKFSIKGQVILTVILILVCSFFATMATYITVAVSSRPANAPEKTVTVVERLISTEGASILERSEQPKLQSLVKGTGVEYFVMNAEAQPIYGPLVGSIKMSRGDLFRQLNTTSVTRQGFGANINKVIPVLGKNGALLGAVYVKWGMFLGGVHSPNLWTRILTFTSLLSPFCYMLLFTYIFARRVGKKMNRPLQALIEATHRIKERDLDFSIEHQGNNEIGKVLDAFEDMRQSLKESLLVQWSIEEERREMLAAISHDLRTPIAIIQGHAENLLENPSSSPERLRRYMETIARNTNRVVRLMNDFRTVTDIDSPGFSLHPVNVHVEEYMHSKYDEYVIMARERDISLSMDYVENGVGIENGPDRHGESGTDRHRESGTGRSVEMVIDTDRVSQVIDNLMANAVRFTPSGGQIFWKVNVDGDRLTMEIEDTGTGLPKDEPGRIFQKFYQGDKSRSGEQGHSGLGLYIVRALVERHGGSVSAKNNIHGGATFQFCIPSIKQKSTSNGK